MAVKMLVASARCSISCLMTLDQRGFPGLHPGELLGRQALVRRALERELRVQVLAQQAVLDLARFAEEIDELLAALDLQWRLRVILQPGFPGDGSSAWIKPLWPGRWVASRAQVFAPMPTTARPAIETPPTVGPALRAMSCAAASSDADARRPSTRRSTAPSTSRTRKSTPTCPVRRRSNVACDLFGKRL